MFVHVCQSQCALALCPAWAIIFLLYHFVMQPPLVDDFPPVHLHLGQILLTVLCLWLSQLICPRVEGCVSISFATPVSDGNRDI